MPMSYDKKRNIATLFLFFLTKRSEHICFTAQELKLSFFLHSIVAN